MSAIVSPIREPLITGNKSYHDITEDLVGPTEKAPGLSWMIAMGFAVVALAVGIFCILWTIWKGIGSWNLNRT
ncbi:MAG: hydrogenase, partial [Bacteroidota bacterium]